MSTRFEIDPPPLLPGRMVSIPQRGEFFIRQSTHKDATAPVVLLMHGWTASSDLNFFTAYHELSEFASVIGIDHRGHGRGLRPDVSFTLEDCADDAAAVCAALGVHQVVAHSNGEGKHVNVHSFASADYSARSHDASFDPVPSGSHFLAVSLVDIRCERILDG
jgi:pimeloyl-ACP methyl ester carboxylesterase